MLKTVKLVVLVFVVMLAGSLLLTSCAKDQVKDDPALMSAEEKARLEAEEKARLERERMERERAISEQKLREDQIRALREKFQERKVYFSYDSAVLSEEAQSVLREKAEFLKQNAGKSLMIEGHCDERGSVEYNLALGQRRAESVMKYLTLLGIGPDRMRTISYGKERPVDPRHNEDAWAKNRRAEFVLMD